MHPREFIAKHIKATLEKEEFPPHAVSLGVKEATFFFDRTPSFAKGKGHCCKVSDEAAFCLIQRPYISKTLLTRRISPRGSP